MLKNVPGKLRGNFMSEKVRGGLREQLMLEKVPGEVRGKVMLEKVHMCKTDVRISAWGSEWKTYVRKLNFFLGNVMSIQFFFCFLICQ